MTLDFLAGVLLVAIIVTNVIALFGALTISQGTRLAVAAVVGLWTGLQIALALVGAFANQFALSLPLLGAMVILPPALVALAAAFSQAVRAALLALPQSLLVGLNAGRLLGLFFLLLAAAGELGGPFPQFAGWGDVAAGGLALPLAFRIARKDAASWMIAGWNVFGAADLVVAVSLGVLSANGAPVQLIVAGAGSDAIVRFPWSLIPTVLVPFYLVIHGIVFAQLRLAERQRRGMAVA